MNQPPLLAVMSRSRPRWLRGGAVFLAASQGHSTTTRYRLSVCRARPRSREACLARVRVTYLGKTMEEAPRSSFLARPMYPHSQAQLSAISQLQQEAGATRNCFVLKGRPSLPTRIHAVAVGTGHVLRSPRRCVCRNRLSIARDCTLSPEFVTSRVFSKLVSVLPFCRSFE